MHPAFESILDALLEACRTHYRDRLVALVIYGSVGRGTARHDSDIDCLIVADPLPQGRSARAAEFDTIETALAGPLTTAQRDGVTPLLSPIFKTPAEIVRGTPLLLDMTEDARLLFDRDGFMRQSLADFKARLDRLGARRIWRGSAWFWDLKPDYRPGEIFEI